MNEHAHSSPAAQASLRGYLIGFGLSVVLTALAFGLVMTGALANAQATAAVIVVLAVTQIVVHMVYFLHMNTRVEQGWAMMALIFTILMVFIGVAGSLWVMHHLNVNMMPGAR